jgi:hypothetical protein
VVAAVILTALVAVVREQEAQGLSARGLLGHQEFPTRRRCLLLRKTTLGVAVVQDQKLVLVAWPSLVAAEAA